MNPVLTVSRGSAMARPLGTVTCRLHASIRQGGAAVNGDRRHRRTQAERSATTRGALLDAGRALIVERAGVTRGALYHHFAGKEDLFRAVFEEIEHEMTEHLAKVALAAPDPLEALRLGCREFLDVAMAPEVQRIVLVDA